MSEKLGFRVAAMVAVVPAVDVEEVIVVVTVVVAVFRSGALNFARESLTDRTVH